MAPHPPDPPPAMIRVQSIAPDSIASDLGLAPGTELHTINGQELFDFLDWEFLSADDRFDLRATLPTGEEVVYDIERPEGMPFGIELEPPRVRRCANKCDFCFVDGLPDGLRETLYIRDDDYRLSFRYGNFATLTNLKERDVERIVAYRLSPLYISVHATDPVVRRRLLRNPLAPDVTEQIRDFAARGGIQFHAQIVLQPGLNDGAVLERSLEDLYRLGSDVMSVAVVPVGLTEFSKHDLVHEPNAEECRHVVALVEARAERARRERNETWAFGSDELYIRAGLPLPPAEIYGDFDQAENGVGSVRRLEQRIAAAGRLRTLEGARVGVVTGAAMGHLLPLVLPSLEERTGARFDLIVVENAVFGPRVTTAGLIPGAGIRDALRDRSDWAFALIPAEALNDADRFIDDLTFDELRSDVDVDVHSSYDFADVLSDDT